MRISDWSSDVCSSDLRDQGQAQGMVCVRPQGLGHLARRAVLWFRDSRCDRQVLLRLARRADRLHGLVQGAMRKRSEEHTSELQSLMRISYAVFCLKTKQE